jgi:hypothetical protein
VVVSDREGLMALRLPPQARVEQIAMLPMRGLPPLSFSSWQAISRVVNSWVKGSRHEDDDRAGVRVQ